MVPLCLALADDGREALGQRGPREARDLPAARVGGAGANAVNCGRTEDGDLDNVRVGCDGDLVDVAVVRAVGQGDQTLNVVDVVVFLLGKGRSTLALVLGVVPCEDGGAGRVDPEPGVVGRMSLLQALGNGDSSGVVIGGVGRVCAGVSNGATEQMIPVNVRTTMSA